MYWLSKFCIMIWPLLIHHLCCVWSTVENSGAIGATNIFAVWICFESKKCLEITNMKCVIKVVLTQGLNLRPFESSIWLSNRILRIKTHTLAISWVCISICPRSFLISKTDSPWINIRQNWFIFTARFRTKSLSRNFERCCVTNILHLSPTHFTNIRDHYRFQQ